MHRNKQSLAVPNGKRRRIKLPLEFEGRRAFAVWDSITIRGYRFTARIEVNPKLLRKPHGHEATYLYTGKLALPQPEQN